MNTIFRDDELAAFRSDVTAVRNILREQKVACHKCAAADLHAGVDVNGNTKTTIVADRRSKFREAGLHRRFMNSGRNFFFIESEIAGHASASERNIIADHTVSDERHMCPDMMPEDA